MDRFSLMRSNLLLVLFAVFVSGCAHTEGPKVSTTVDSSAPNIVIIVADDLGWRDVGFNGSEIRTPNLDGLAANGVILDRFYAQPTCSPSRAALLTGRSSVRLGVLSPISKNNPIGLPLNETLLSQYLGSNGYQTAMVGKWHLGGNQRAFLPNARGFEYFYGFLNGGIGYWTKTHGGGFDWQRNGASVREDGYATTLLSADAVRIVRERDKSRALFLYVAYGAPHLPNEAPQELIASYENIGDPFRRVHAAMVSELDNGIGDIVRTLEDEGILQNTIIWFMSDNGGLLPEPSPPPGEETLEFAIEQSRRSGIELTAHFLDFRRMNRTEGGSNNSPLRGQKDTVWEGGVRVPSILFWGENLPSRVVSEMITLEDVFPTLVSAAGLSISLDGLDGRNTWSTITTGSELEEQPYVVHATKGGVSEAVYLFPWKMVVREGNAPELFNVVNDPKEKADLSEYYPDVIKTMSEILDGWPRGPDIAIPFQRIVDDTDTFGGAEDRQPWAEAVQD